MNVTVENTAKVEHSMGPPTHIIHMYSKAAELDTGTVTPTISCLWASSICVFLTVMAACQHCQH